VLAAYDRNRRRIVLKGEQGTEFLLDFAKPVTLRDGDGLVLDDGAIVLVAGESERLVEISAPSALDAVRLAWHLGNRHTDVQIVGDRLRIRRDHVLEDMLRGLGATLNAVEAPFDPEGQPHGA
jgi:urease accessory protein